MMVIRTYNNTICVTRSIKQPVPYITMKGLTCFILKNKYNRKGIQGKLNSGF